MFKWSQFNGGLVGRGKFKASENKFEITANKQAITTCDLEDFYLEALEYDELEGYWKVVYGARVSLDGNDLNVVGQPLFKVKDPTNPVFFRLWNGIDEISNFPVAASPTQLEYGIHLEFDNSGSYRPGDFWTFDVRVDFDNDQILINNQPPQGILYHRLPLAILHWDDDANNQPEISFEEGKITDCRDIFRPLTKQTVCCSYVVGDGDSSFGDFNSIEEALRHLPEMGGKICLLPGIHLANAEINNRKNIQIVGCGLHTIVQPSPKKPNDPIFTVSQSENIKLDNMTLITYSGTAIQVLDSPGSKKATREIYITNNRISASAHAVDIQTDQENALSNDIHILSNQIGMLDVSEGKAGIFSIADVVDISDNLIVVVPAPDPDNTHDPRNSGERKPIFPDPCEDPPSRYNRDYPTKEFVHDTWSYVSGASNLYIPPQIYSALGGIQIGSGSEDIFISHNRIIGGASNGITLGHLPSSLEEMNNSISMVGDSIFWLDPETLEDVLENLTEIYKAHPNFLYGITIEDNVIRSMGLSGIGTIISGDPEITGVMTSVDDLTIYRNMIMYCVQQFPDKLPIAFSKKMGIGGISLVDCENVLIQENRIKNNGLGEDGFIYNNPVCGVYVFHGASIDISNNRILNNGPWDANSEMPVRLGVRGGIVILSSMKSSLEEKTSKDQYSPDGIPAIKIHNNIITQPLGQALFTIALGPISVINNHLTSQACDFKFNRISLLAGSVFILNLGISKDLLLLMPTRFGNLGSFDLSALQKSYGGKANLLDQLRKFIYLPSGKVLFANNQITLDLREEEINFALSSVLIASLDDVALNNNQSECTSLLDIVLTDVAIFGVTIRSNDNRFQEGLTAVLFSLFSFGFMNLTTTNQATHCLHTLGFRVKRFGNMVIFDKECPGEEESINTYYGTDSPTHG
jgi:hypothetical protein